MANLAIGTVQFGQHYGVSNVDGQPDEEGVRKILELAQKKGICTLDTSPAYGDAEGLIGRAIHSSDAFKIITKTPTLSAIGSGKPITSEII